MRTKEKWINLTLSLAGLLQATKLVKELARTGKTDEIAFENSIKSIFKINSTSLNEIYGGAESVKLGLKQIIHLLSKKNKKSDLDIIRYVVSLMYLEKKFTRSSELKKILSRRIQQAQSQANHFSITDPLVIETLAGAFLQTLGRFHYRIQVVGSASCLKQKEIVSKIRALLLAGIRSAVLWKQMGGNKWYLFFFRKKMINVAKALLNGP